MAVRVKVGLNKQIIVPIRFTRAVTGDPQLDSPDVDDRGFAMGARPGTWGTSDCRGAMVGITEGDTVNIKVLREDIDASAPLVVTSTNTSVARIAGPAGGVLGADGIFQVRGVLDTRNASIKIQVHLGDADGPVLGELEPHIFQLRRLRVRAHIVSINGIPTTRTAASLTALFEFVNRIWRPCGIQFDYDAAEIRNTPVNGLATAGQMTTNLSGTPPTFNEFSTIINTNFDPNRTNVYFVRAANEVNGLTFDNSVARNNGFGVVIADTGTPFSVSHELCHYLDSPVHACENAARTHIRDDIWSLRSVMFHTNIYAAQAVAHRNDVGYGNRIRGALILLKDFGADDADGETARARRRSLNPN